MKLQVPHHAGNFLNSQELAASQGLCSMSSVSSLIRALNNGWALYTYLLLSGLLNSTINSLEYNASDYIFRDYSGKLVTVQS
jgi:hypothetical protein